MVYDSNLHISQHLQYFKFNSNMSTLGTKTDCAAIVPAGLVFYLYFSFCRPDVLILACLCPLGFTVSAYKGC